VIVKPEKRRCGQNLSRIAAVLLISGIAPINKSGFAYLWQRVTDRQTAASDSLRDVFRVNWTA
jgi:hypothetical protein